MVSSALAEKPVLGKARSVIVSPGREIRIHVGVDVPGKAVSQCLRGRHIPHRLMYASVGKPFGLHPMLIAFLAW